MKSVIRGNCFSSLQQVSANTNSTISTSWKEALIVVSVGGSAQTFTATVLNGMAGDVHFGGNPSTGLGYASVNVNGSTFKLTSCYWYGANRTSDSKMTVYYR